MPNPTLQEILTHFHDRGYKDTTLAKFVGLSQATINNIRNGKQSGERNQDKFRTLIHAFLNNEELDIPHATLPIPKPVLNTPKPANTTPTHTNDTAQDDNKPDDSINDEKPATQPIHVASFIIPLIFILGTLLFISHMTKQNRVIQQTHTTPIASEPVSNNGNTPINTPFPYQYGYHIQGDIGF
jgi:hypothetical protein